MTVKRIVIALIILVLVFCAWFANFGCGFVPTSLNGDGDADVNVPVEFWEDVTFHVPPTVVGNGNANDNDNGNDHPLPDSGELEVKVTAPVGGSTFGIGEEITFSGEWEGGEPPFEVKWFFPDGDLEKKEGFEGHEFSVTKSFTIPGGGPARLIVEDSSGHEVSRSVMVTIREE